MYNLTLRDGKFNMTAKIRVLDELTINQIAAGEVIENPSSVVKELVENAIDAGSTEITIEIKGGGRQLIRITDNGCGMNHDDAILCIERHATSKLKNFDDLSSLLTMGFRGEALPSIASISQFMLLTRTKDQPEDKGTLVSLDGGKMLKCSTCVRDVGTTIEVKNLFFNVPVRRKFQKSPSVDSNEIVKSVTAMTLAHPKIRFQLIIDTKCALTTPGNNAAEFLEALKRRIEDTLGFAFLEELLPLSLNNEEYKIEGYISMPFHHRPNRSSQFLFVNGRALYSPLVSYAVKDGYGFSIPQGRFPSYVLHLTLPCEDFDINVHPQKKEVRFRREDKLKEILKHAIESAIQQPRIIPQIEETVRPPLEIPVQYSSYKLPEKERSFSFPALKVEEKPMQLPKMPFKPSCIACFNDFIVLENPPEGLFSNDGICLAHKKNAYARIIYEKALKSLQGQKDAFGSQSLLVPATMELIPADAEILRQNLVSLNKLGFEIREFGQRTFFIEALPEHLNVEMVEFVLQNMIASLKEGLENFGWQKEESQKMALATAKSAVLKNQKMSIAEGQSLINQLLDCQQPYFSPLGPSIFAMLNEDLLQNLFKK